MTQNGRAITFKYNNGSGEATLRLDNLLPCSVGHLRKLDKKLLRLSPDTKEIYGAMKAYLVEVINYYGVGIVDGFKAKAHEYERMSESLERKIAFLEKMKKGDISAKKEVKELKKRKNEYSRIMRESRSIANQEEKRQKTAKEDLNYLDEVDGTWQQLLD